MNEYQQAVTALRSVVSDGKHLDESLANEASPLAQQIAYGACRFYFYYEEVVNLLLDKPLPPKHLDLKLLLIAGLYSIDHLHRPAHASVNRVVETTGSLKKVWAKGMTNAVLRRYGREKNGREKNGREKDALQSKISQQGILNHPAWLIQQIETDWPENPHIFDSNNQQAPMTLRVNAMKSSTPDYLKLLADSGVEAHANALCSSAITLNEAVPVADLPGFSDGLVSVQDEAPQLAPSLMNLFPGAKVLDACAAPGGKTCHLLEACPSIELTAIDRDRKRIGRIEDNLQRLSLSATVIATDLMDYTADQPFDRILLDVPCSASGIIRRHPDIKLLREADDVAKLAAIQRELLDKAFDLLTIDGELLYSTCSILRTENDGVISSFLQETPQAISVPLRISASQSIQPTAFGIQLLPTTDAHDGFYYSLVRKVRVEEALE